MGCPVSQIFMIFSLPAGDNEPLSCMGGYASKHTGVVVEPAGPGKNQEELSCVVPYHKNRISFSDFHILSHAAKNQPNGTETYARQHPVTKHMPRVSARYEHDGIATPGGK